MLSPDSKIMDLQWTMAEFISIAEEYEDIGHELDGWEKSIVGHSKKHSIDLGFTADRAQRMETREGDVVDLPEDDAVGDSFQWKTTVVPVA